MWIDQGSFLLLKVSQSSVIGESLPEFLAKLTARGVSARQVRKIRHLYTPPVTVETTTTYRPDINVPISAAELSFRPPRKK